QFLRKGLIEEALFLLDPIEKIISEISHEKINDRISLEILEHCSRLNEEIVLRFETEKFALKKGMFQAEVERKIREFLS
ncbi:MAG: hypothetical protein OEZ34_12990, partial [Spirochaetia bacterium]|nr:hypothetical protein [Spirochaetia bacterium]